jgi:hypothetical protein
MMGEVPGKWALVGGAIVFTAITFRCVVSALKPKESHAEMPAN